MRKEVELAKVETKEEASRAAKAGGSARPAAAWRPGSACCSRRWPRRCLLDQALNRALAFLIVALVWLVAAVITIQAGRRRIRDLGGPSPNNGERSRRTWHGPKSRRAEAGDRRHSG